MWWQIIPLLFVVMVTVCSGRVEVDHADDMNGRISREADDTKLGASLTLNITTILEPPFLMMMKNNDGLEGNARFEGYIADLLENIAKKIGFEYTLQLVPDGRYGSTKGDGNWTGMIGQVANEEVDLAAAPITITSIRENVVDFSKPFMHTSIRALMKKPSVDSKTTSLFGIFTPFTFWVWICIVISFLVVGLVMFFLSRMSPYGWRALYTRGEVSWDEGQYFNCLNSFWFVMSTFTLQGYHNAPRSVATRFLSGIWFFFTLVILFAYLSNLGAFLTVERMDHPIQNVDDLSRQTTIRYGTNEFGATAVFFRNSNVPIYQRMWEFMSEAVPSVFTYGSEEGIQRVIKSNGRYVYFGESALLQYAASRDCSLSLMPGALNLRSYGFAFPTGSTLRDEFSGAILELQENGNLQLLYTKWFFGPCSSEQEDLEDDDRVRVAALPLVNLSGAFIILLIGVAISIPLALCEWVFYNRSDGKRRKSDAPKSDSGAQTVSGV